MSRPFSPAFPFIKDHVEKEFETLNKDVLTPWSFYPTKGISIEGPNKSKGWTYTGQLAFEGTLRNAFWKDLLPRYVDDIAKRSFNEARAFCAVNNLSLPAPLEETASQLGLGVSRTINRMIDIDRRLRGKGFPKDVEPYNASADEKAMEAIIKRHFEAEKSLPGPEITPRHWARTFVLQHPIISGVIAWGMTFLINPLVVRLVDMLFDRLGLKSS